MWDLLIGSKGLIATGRAEKDESKMAEGRIEFGLLSMHYPLFYPLSVQICLLPIFDYKAC